MMKCYGDKAIEESGTRVGELTAAGDHDGVDTWRRDRRRPSSVGKLPRVLIILRRLRLRLSTAFVV
jgi:hypothetical protein